MQVVSTRLSGWLFGGATLLGIGALLLVAYLVVRAILAFAPDAPGVVVTLGVTVTILAGAVLVRNLRARDDSVQAVLLGTSPWLPGTLAVTIVALALTGESSATAIAMGTLVTAIAWLAVGVVMRGDASAANANPRNYAALVDRRMRLEADLALASDPTNWSASSTDQHAMSASACTETRGHLDALSVALGTLQGRPSRGRVWIAGTGYIDLWNRLHRAEEAMIIIAPLPSILAAALYDRLRLLGSDIGHQTELVSRLDAASTTLTSANCTELDRARARAELRIVKNAVNSYRDDQWDSMVRARNQLLKTMVFTGLTANVALVLALVAGADKKVVVAASAFYLIGAMVGLFARLRSEAESTGVVDDYGLTSARLIVTPLASGLAAIAGVVLAARLLLPTAGVIAPETNPFPAPNLAAAAATPSRVASLREIFDLDANPGGLIIAAIFGLTPGLLIDRLQSQGQKFQNNLMTSSPTDTKPKC